jgi:hypothetical protein
MSHYKFLVFSNPAPGREDAYNEWYDGQHLHDVVKVPGFVSAQRFRIVGDAASDNDRWRYLAIYEIETSDLQRTMEALRARAGSSAMIISDALERHSILTIVAEPSGGTVRAG